MEIWSLSDKIKWEFFQAVTVSVLLYGCSAKWEQDEKDATLNKSRKQHPTKQQLYGHLSPISQTIHVRQTRHAGHR